MTSDRSASDAAARRLAQSRFDDPVAVIAGAGTGKTTVLVARVLGWCLGRGWQDAGQRLAKSGTSDPSADEIAAQTLDGLVAITFTEAAAAQMAGRVAQAFATIAADPDSEIVGFYPDLIPDTPPAERQTRARALVGALDHLAVRTIHSHCWHLLATYPLAARLSLDLRVDADGRLLEEIVREVVEEAVRDAYAGSGSHPLRRLAQRRIDPRMIAEAVQRLAADGVTAEALDRDPLSQAGRNALRRELDTLVGALRATSDPLRAQTRAKKDRATAEAICRTVDLLGDAPEALSLQSLADLLDAVREVWPDDLLDRLGKWSKGEFTKTVLDLLGDQSAELANDSRALAGPLGLYRQIDIEVLDSGRRALRPLLATVEDQLRARGILTYSSLMTETWHLLAKHPQVRRRERRRLSQLLVDEFQDTDRLQCDLIRFLALDGDESERPGLFVVGDPKQSIYGWRNADLEAYEGFLRNLEAAGGISVELNRNFRSVPAILEEVDHTIGPIMTAEAGLQPAFSSLLPCADLQADAGFQQAGRAPIEQWVSWDDTRGPRTPADDVAVAEATAIARDIRDLHDQAHVPWSEFGLLLRSTSRLETYLEAMRRFGVPFVVTRDKHYFRRREVIDAAALVRTILVPVDHLALVTFLRSPSVGIPDAALLPLWQRGFPDLVTRLQAIESPEMESLRKILEEVARHLPDDIPGLDSIRGWEFAAIAGLENLAVLRRASATEPADRFIDLLRERFLFDVTEAARHLGPYRLANLDRFFRDLERTLENQNGDIQAVLRSLRRSVSESEEAEQALPEGATEDAVQVMTIHGAKGLEFGHVYLPQLHAKGRANRTPLVEADRRWLPGQEAQYILFGSPTPGFHRVREREAEVERTEQVRTLYVAMTRARNRLVLVGNWPDSTQPVPAHKRATYLDLLRSRDGLPVAMSDLFESLKDRKESFECLGDVLWRFPVLAPTLSAAPATQRPASTTLPSTEDVERDSGRLRELGATAAKRMARPLSGTASGEAATHLDHAGDGEKSEDLRPFHRDVALAVGTAFHRLLERWDLRAEPESELERQRNLQSDWLGESLPAEQVPTGEKQLQDLLHRFQQGRFYSQFSRLRDAEVAREVPVVLPPLKSDEGPLAYLTGFVDLVYRDPQTRDWIIVDYKTDRAEKEPEIEELARAYARQEAVYARAIQESLNLTELPKTQLWFIWPDVLWEETTTS